MRNPGDADAIPIWQAARATCAEPPYFDSIYIKGKTFIGAGFGYNNPTLEAIFEVRQMHQPYSNNQKRSEEGKAQEEYIPINLLISIGSGVRKPLTFSGKGGVRKSLYYLRASKQNLTDTEAIHNDILKMSKVMQGLPSYYRFNVQEGLGTVRLDDWVLRKRHGQTVGNRTLEHIEAMTSAYLRKPEIHADIVLCAQQLVQLRRFRK